MIRSMTSFASQTGQEAGKSWQWELRGVNSRGLDLRLRLPNGAAALEQQLRKLLTQSVARGNVAVSLKVNQEGEGLGMTLNLEALDRALQTLEQVQDRAMGQGITLAQPTAADVLAHRGVLLAQSGDTAALLPDEGVLLDGFAAVLSAFGQMRAEEGAALSAIISDQLDQIEALIKSAKNATGARHADVKANMAKAMARIIENTDAISPDRLAQELALIAVKSDVTEELDRLAAHVPAARELLSKPGPAGRRLDFLAQEFNREANTLCAKSGAVQLTRIGLELKAVIDQMREQIQNVE